ncbi:peptidase inhibitor family I36 protein [Streptomyces abyssomicinicus]|uniref:peptidase inhibitor family I36 protein n=1 Tax=Streptomyces abyssomicinicus TaxID=574929 RepID=UPI00125018CA|nr:peptidase inhibitor family I36 protein [Streptomyces abyssomicinicus]
MRRPSATRRTGIGIALALAALLGGTTATAAAPGGSTAPARAAAQCGPNEICFWQDNDFEGTPWRWTPASGYRDLPPYLHDNVGSFHANAPGCFIDWEPHEMRRVAMGDHSAAYRWGGKFGSRIDAVTIYRNC